MAAVIAGLFKLAVAFISRDDSDRRLRAKKERLRGELKQTCPHMQITSDNSVVMIESLCQSVERNPWVICGVCGK